MAPSGGFLPGFGVSRRIFAASTTKEVGIAVARGILMSLHTSKAGTDFAQSKEIASASAARSQPGEAASRTCSKLSRTAAAARSRSAGFMFASPNMRIGLPLHVMASKPVWL